MDILDITQELEQNAKDFKTIAFEYKKERGLYAEALTKLIMLLHNTNLSKSTASFENKLPRLLDTEYAEQAKKLIEQLYTSRANYKGLEIVCDAYKAGIGSKQSVIKYNLNAEIGTAINNKFAQDNFF